MNTPLFFLSVSLSPLSSVRSTHESSRLRPSSDGPSQFQATHSYPHQQPAILDEPEDSVNSSDYVTHLKLLAGAGNEGMAICRDKS